MVTRAPAAAPLNSLPEERRGRVVGRFCLHCATIYPLHAARHKGKPVAGRDHIASVCPSEGRPFEAGATWWEPAVEPLPSSEEE